MFLPCIYKPNSVEDSNLSRPKVTLGLKRFFPRLCSGLVLSLSKDTILHARKYFAVSPELNRFVTVLNSTLASDGRYPLRLILRLLSGLRVRTFLPLIETRE